MNILPKGTHEYSKFIKPSELENWARAADLQLRELTGMSYNILTKKYSLGNDVAVNYLMHTQK
jgi:3-demethylubiquinone-9 3-methyltransferase (EC 2.1.1.64)